MQRFNNKRNNNEKASLDKVHDDGLDEKAIKEMNPKLIW